MLSTHTFIYSCIACVAMQQAKTQNNVEGNNGKNQEIILKNLSNQDFYRIRSAVVTLQNRMRSKDKKKLLADSWLKLEQAWYNGLEESD
jgi:hypothetical protein